MVVWIQPDFRRRQVQPRGQWFNTGYFVKDEFRHSFIIYSIYYGINGNTLTVQYNSWLSGMNSTDLITECVIMVDRATELWVRLGETRPSFLFFLFHAAQVDRECSSRRRCCHALSGGGFVSTRLLSRDPQHRRHNSQSKSQWIRNTLPVLLFNGSFRMTSFQWTADDLLIDFPLPANRSMIRRRQIQRRLIILSKKDTSSNVSLLSENLLMIYLNVTVV